MQRHRRHGDAHRRRAGARGAASAAARSTRQGDPAWRSLFLLPSLVIFVVFFFLPFVRLFSWGTYQQNRRAAPSCD